MAITLKVTCKLNSFSLKFETPYNQKSSLSMRFVGAKIIEKEVIFNRELCIHMFLTLWKIKSGLYNHI